MWNKIVDTQIYPDTFSCLVFDNGARIISGGMTAYSTNAAEKSGHLFLEN